MPYRRELKTPEQALPLIKDAIAERIGRPIPWLLVEKYALLFLTWDHDESESIILSFEIAIKWRRTVAMTLLQDLRSFTEVQRMFSFVYGYGELHKELGLVIQAVNEIANKVSPLLSDEAWRKENEKNKKLRRG